MKYTHQLITAIDAALCAGEEILEIYQSDFAVQSKADRSPLTLADTKAHEIITESVAQHGIPVISEEGREIPFEERSKWNPVWIIDPLDGTKEFIKRNGEFTVNIALIEKQQPVLGVVYAPVRKWLYFASKEIGAFKVTDVNWAHCAASIEKGHEERLHEWMVKGNKLPIGDDDQRVYTIVGSRSHGTDELDAFVDKKREERGEVAFIAAGSSLKICLVAEGTADVYPRLGPTMEWDTAAGQAIAECAGATVYIYENGKVLEYNREDMLNPWFMVERV